MPFEAVNYRLAGPVYGVIGRVLRDPSQSEVGTQEVLLEMWRTARGSTWPSVARRRG